MRRTRLAMAFLGVSGAVLGMLAFGGCAHPQQTAKTTVPTATAPARPPQATEPAATVAATTGEDGAGVRVGDNSLYFDYDAAALTDQATNLLQQVATELQKKPGEKVKIEGNCDERGTDEYNLALGAQRAEVARRYLERLGVQSSRIATVSYGAERPRAQGHDEEAWQKNRRDDVSLR